jgi:hypothetical protein
MAHASHTDLHGPRRSIVIRSLNLVFALFLHSLAVAAEPELPGTAADVNLMVDPFSVKAKLVLPPPPLKSSATALPPVPLPPMFAPAQPLPLGLRAILIRDNGQGLLGSADAGAYSIPVAHGKQVRIGDQDYHAEVSKTEIRLYSSPKGKLVWEGTLGGPALISAPIDMSQLRFVPPLSAGVNPGLKSGAGSAATKTSESP